MSKSMKAEFSGKVAVHWDNPQKIYVVCKCEQTLTMEAVDGREFPIQLPDGIYGYMPCFTDLEMAKKVAGKKYKIMTGEAVEREEQ